MDDTSNLKGSGARIVLKGPDDLLEDHSLMLEFKANNNKVEYEVIIINMVISIKMGVSSLKAINDS